MIASAAAGGVHAGFPHLFDWLGWVTSTLFTALLVGLAVQQWRSTRPIVVARNVSPIGDPWKAVVENRGSAGVLLRGLQVCSGPLTSKELAGRKPGAMARMWRRRRVELGFAVLPPFVANAKRTETGEVYLPPHSFLEMEFEPPRLEFQHPSWVEVKPWIAHGHAAWTRARRISEGISN
jgi:hypothetical protein